MEDRLDYINIKYGKVNLNQIWEFENDLLLSITDHYNIGKLNDQ